MSNYCRSDLTLEVVSFSFFIMSSSPVITASAEIAARKTVSLFACIAKMAAMKNVLSPSSDTSGKQGC